MTARPTASMAPKTDAAIRDFEQAAGLRPVGRAERRAAGVDRALGRQGAAGRHPARTIRSRRCWRRAARIVAVQRALTDFGYGQIKPTGIYDPETRAAIERFEKARRRPVTGQVSDRLVRDLAALTGRPLE